MSSRRSLPPRSAKSVSSYAETETDEESLAKMVANHRSRNHHILCRFEADGVFQCIHCNRADWMEDVKLIEQVIYDSFFIPGDRLILRCTLNVAEENSFLLATVVAVASRKEYICGDYALLQQEHIAENAVQQTDS